MANDRIEVPLYCFLQDDALKLIPNNQYINIDNSDDQGYGIFTGEIKNYIIEPIVISDPRTERLPIVDNCRGNGKLSIVFDKKHFDVNVFENMEERQLILFFNVLERLYLQNISSIPSLENELAGHLYATYMSTGYRENGYVENSGSSSASINNQVKFIDDTSVHSRHAVSLHDHFSFDFKRGNITFKVFCWISKAAFATDYPYTHITSVIPPYDPALLKSPSTLITSGNLNILAASSQFIFDKAHTETNIRDQSGIYSYTTRYMLDTTRSINIPFALPYCGAHTPSTLNCREAIRNYLENNMDISIESIQSLFPELYIASRFFLIPLWDMYYQATDREIYNSVVSYQQIKNKAFTAFPLLSDKFDETYIENYLELIWQAYNKTPIISIPDTLNDPYFSILGQHPTYQDYSTQVPGWVYMSSATQDFASKLIRCMAQLNGAEASNEFKIEYINDLKFLSFTTGGSEYLLMYESSYKTIQF